MKKINISNTDLFALVDDSDFDSLNKYKWKLTKGYATRNAWDNLNKRYKFLSMHRVIMKAPQNKEVDHINHNTLDNRKVNLRLCSVAENRRNARKRSDNKTGYKGIYYEKRTGKYYAQITVNKIIMHIGTFKTKEQAFLSRQIVAKKYHKEFYYA